MENSVSRNQLSKLLQKHLATRRKETTAGVLLWRTSGFNTRLASSLSQKTGLFESVKSYTRAVKDEVCNFFYVETLTPSQPKNAATTNEPLGGWFSWNDFHWHDKLKITFLTNKCHIYSFYPNTTKPLLIHLLELHILDHLHRAMLIVTIW